MAPDRIAALCDARNSVLLIVDIQSRLTAVMPPKVLARLQRNVTMLLQAAQKLRIPVFASEQYPQGLGPLEQDIVRLLPEGSRRYSKTAFSLSGDPGFSRDLEAAGRRQVILTGMEAHICVLQTAIELGAAGYSVFVVADAICSRHRENYETALSRMRRAGVTVCDAESVVFEWLRDARHEQFKPLQALIS
jgi:nicotinamidase-related amidase